MRPPEQLTRSPIGIALQVRGAGLAPVNALVEEHLYGDLCDVADRLRQRMHGVCRDVDYCPYRVL